VTATQTLRRGRPSAEDSRAKLAHILTVARELFIERGYRAVTMRDVAERAQVSTRTIYNHYADKLSLFNACLDFGSVDFPLLAWSPAEDVEQALCRFAAEVVRVLSMDSSMMMGRLVYREGADFPEVVRAAQDVERRHLIEPLVFYLRRARLADEEDAAPRAKLFLALAIAEWERAVSYRLPLPDSAAIERHAALAVRLFLDGARRM
jgi:TetR/AcrR family transcriptional regulator, mexJK operon transcriptional repressor